MVLFRDITLQTFLRDFWQKKFCIFRQALPEFTLSLSSEELAGLAMEDDIESRLVNYGPNDNSSWQLKRGPFTENDFNQLPSTNWTLLVQGVDRFVPEVAALIDNFNFIPQWRFDDVMVSFAVKGGSVGPHYDNYDVFLFQAKGRRKWTLTTKNCVEDNYLTGLDLRIMKDFQVENEFILEEGDMLYLPPHVGHHGVALTDDCMTYSFGYRSYPHQEMWDNLGEHIAQLPKVLYQDADLTKSVGTNEIPDSAWKEAKKLLKKVLDDDLLMQNWFARFVTTLDEQAELLSLDNQGHLSEDEFANELDQSQGLIRNSIARFAYFTHEKQLILYINGEQWPSNDIPPELIKMLANQRHLTLNELQPFLNPNVTLFLYRLWHSNCIEIL